MKCDAVKILINNENYLTTKRLKLPGADVLFYTNFFSTSFFACVNSLKVFSDLQNFCEMS